MRELSYTLCDVFTETPLTGNQLAVFHDGSGLTDAEMQALARETNLSETTFLLRRTPEVERERGLRVRIFTVQEELPFAGHPTLGTASVARTLLPEYHGAETITLDLNAGRVPVRFAPGKQKPRIAFGEMTQPEPRFGAFHDPAAVAAAIGMTPHDLAPHAPIQTVSTGIAYCIVPLRSVETLERLQISQRDAAAYLAKTDAKFFYCIAREAPGEWRTRMQFYNGEDPATGSAAGCAIAWLVRHGQEPSEAPVHLRQGIEIKRPSDLYATAKLFGETVSEVRVAGSTVPVANGLLFLE